MHMHMHVEGVTFPAYHPSGAAVARGDARARLSRPDLARSAAPLRHPRRHRRPAAGPSSRAPTAAAGAVGLLSGGVLGGRLLLLEMRRQTDRQTHTCTHGVPRPRHTHAHACACHAAHGTPLTRSARLPRASYADCFFGSDCARRAGSPREGRQASTHAPPLYRAAPPPRATSILLHLAFD